MHVIYAEHPDSALYVGLNHLKTWGQEEPSRNGTVLVSPCPVTTVYSTPRARVSFDPVRDANPFFHLAEAMWMLAGRNDVAFVANFAKSMATFSDNGTTLHGAYGHRWRKWFLVDQLDAIVKSMAENNASRREVLSMWDPYEDPSVAAQGGKDVPCNTQAYFRARADGLGGHELDLTVTCRSNDIVWGAYGANVVHFSLLLEYMADRLGMRMGRYYQVSNNYHAYIDRPDVARLMSYASAPGCPLAAPRHLYQHPLGAGAPGFDDAVNEALQGLVPSASFPFIDTVLRPMLAAHRLHKAGDTVAAMELLKPRLDIDWLDAGHAWLSRRYNNKNLAASMETR